MDSIIEVKMGELKVSRNPTTFCCLGLGSCVALFLHDPDEKVGGVAHVMLPDSTITRWKVSNHDGKFSNTSPEVLRKQLLNIGASTENISAKLVGGADMFPRPETDLLSRLGERIVDRLKLELERLQIPIIAEDVGGHRGRSVYFHLNTGITMIKTAFDKEREL